MKDYLKGAAPAMPCKDVAATIEFYKEKLGFDKTWVHQDFYGGAYNGSVEFHFFKAQGEFTPSYVYTFADNVDKIYEFLKGNGVDIPNPPADQPYNMRDFMAKDNNGNMISFGQEIKK